MIKPNEPSLEHQIAPLDATERLHVSACGSAAQHADLSAQKHCGEHDPKTRPQQRHKRMAHVKLATVDGHLVIDPNDVAAAPRQGAPACLARPPATRVHRAWVASDGNLGALASPQSVRIGNWVNSVRFWSQNIAPGFVALAGLAGLAGLTGISLFAISMVGSDEVASARVANAAQKSSPDAEHDKAASGKNSTYHPKTPSSPSSPSTTSTTSESAIVSRAP